jgi:solute carrier family 25 carnitine/acylcarnitine transporter 20/29
MREVPSIAAQFAAYEYLKAAFLRHSQSEKLSLHQVMITGGLAGMFCWLVSYPQDIIKTRLQLDPSYKLRSSLSDGGFWNCTKAIYRYDGMKGFFQGLTPCLIRAYLANAIGFFIYEEIKSTIKTYR